MLTAGIIGLPNVGKSTLFNAVLRARKAAAENFPFCTIEPNLGVVHVPDERLDCLAKLVGVDTVIPAAIELFDIAGLVAGASKGEGLGNQFLAHIREVNAIVHVVRCFEDEDIHHVSGSIDPVRDLGIVNTELILADLEMLRRRQEKLDKDLKRHDAHALAEEAVLKRIAAHLNAGQPALTLSLHAEEKILARHCPLLTSKPTLIAANVKEDQLAEADRLPAVQATRAFARTHQGCDTVVLSAGLESDLIDLPPNEAAEYLKMLGVTRRGVDDLIAGIYRLLGLRTFFTFNEKEVRAWPVPGGTTAPLAAGVIHTDFQRGFIKAETVALPDLLRCGSVGHAREQGLYRMEGKEYAVQDGDVIHFKFHV